MWTMLLPTSNHKENIEDMELDLNTETAILNKLTENFESKENISNGDEILDLTPLLNLQILENHLHLDNVVRLLANSPSLPWMICLAVDLSAILIFAIFRNNERKKYEVEIAKKNNEIESLLKSKNESDKEYSEMWKLFYDEQHEHYKYVQKVELKLKTLTATTGNIFQPQTIDRHCKGDSSFMSKWKPYVFEEVKMDKTFKGYQRSTTDHLSNYNTYRDIPSFVSERDAISFL